MRIFLTALLSLALSVSAFAGQELRLFGAKRWLTVASTRDLDTAIAIAGVYAWQKARVVTSRSGWYAVVMGPFEAPTVAAVLKENPQIGEVPEDARLSRGENYLEQVWQERAGESRAFVEYAPNKPARLSAAGIDFSVAMSGSVEEPGPATATGEKDGQKLFSFTTPSEFALVGAEAALLKLDPATDVPQLVFSRYTGGAHCCTQSWIVTRPQGQEGWTLIDMGLLDAGGYGYRDLDGDEAMELISVDNNFLYAFDAYAGSFAPIRISHLRDGQLSDVSDAAQFRSELRRDLARMEFYAKLDPSIWKTNGFLVGWLAAKMRLGQGEDAWQTVQENVDRNNGFGPQLCKTGEPVESCKFDDLVPVPILEAIARFMSERDYGPLPEAAQALLSQN
jgi:serine protease Do